MDCDCQGGCLDCLPYKLLSLETQAEDEPTMPLDLINCDKCDASDEAFALIMFFHKADCVPCQRVKPMMQQMERDGYPVAWYDAVEVKETDPDLLTRLAVRSVPTVVVVDKDGQRVAGWTGGMIHRESIERVFHATEPNW